jgi:hypothetical protein
MPWPGVNLAQTPALSPVKCLPKLFPFSGRCNSLPETPAVVGLDYMHAGESEKLPRTVGESVYSRCRSEMSPLERSWRCGRTF